MTRNVLLPDGSRARGRRQDYAWRAVPRTSSATTAPLPDYFVTAQTLTPADHLAMQAAAQKYVDSSISKTINVPATSPSRPSRTSTRRPIELGCKGCTTYRPNDVTGSVLCEAAAAEAQSDEPRRCRSSRQPAARMPAASST